MRISQSSLEAFSAGPTPLPPPVEPLLTLAEEVVLLSLDAPRRLLRHVTRVAGKAYPDDPRRYDAALDKLPSAGCSTTASPRRWRASGLARHACARSCAAPRGRPDATPSCSRCSPPPARCRSTAAPTICTRARGSP